MRRNPATIVDGWIIFQGGATRRLSWRERVAIRVCRWAGGKFASKP